MSTIPAPSPIRPESRVTLRPRLTPALFIVLTLAVLGVTSIWSSARLLWALWTTDALKSIGMIVPLVSFLLILRAWRVLRWEMQGTWWGLAILIITAFLVQLRDQAVLLLVLTSHWSIYFPPHSLVAFAYGAGVVLLFGGTRLFRAARFPLLLLFSVNPVPHIFNVFIDLPLQRASAHVARSFAIALGQPLSPDKLRLMFTPDFGMFIAPGCNGIRGAVTMGLIALIAGHLYRLSRRSHLSLVAAAIALGYLFNLLRLCVLVLFYAVALHLPSLQSHAEMADYIIGATLFLAATLLLMHFLQQLTPRPAPPTPAPRPTPAAYLYPRIAAMTALVAISCLSILRQHTATSLMADTPPAAFPEHIGSFTLVRSWDETLLTGPLLFHWADYAPTEGGTHIAIGISPVLGSHDTLICHSARGDTPLWQGQSTFPTAASAINFSTALFNDGAVQSLEASTLCTGSSCGEYAAGPAHFGLVYSRLDPASLLTRQAQRPIPILLRAETIDTTLAAAIARQQLSGDLRAFLQSADLNQLTRPYRPT